MCLHSSYENEFRSILKISLPSILVLMLDKPILFHVLFIRSNELIPNPTGPLVFNVSEINKLFEIFFNFSSLKLEFEPLIEFSGINL